MKHILTGAAALLVSTTIATAGGLDRSGQPVDAIFETGTYAELSFGTVDPDQSGTLAGLPSGDVNPAYGQMGAAVKWDVSPSMSLALIYDQPFGALTEYSTPGYPLLGAGVDLSSASVTALARYRMDNGMSVHGGLRVVSAQAVLKGGSYVAAQTASGTGFVLGAAYEKPEIALRAALTYSSGIDMTHDASFAPGAPAMPDAVNYRLPQSVNLDLQTGIAPGTLVFANIRWAEWSKADITGPGGAMINDFATDSIEYSVGIGRQVTDRFAASISYGWENGFGDPVSDISPSDGTKGVSLAGSYDLTESLTLGGGVTYQWRGDATTTNGASFTDNSLLGAGIKISYNF